MNALRATLALLAVVLLTAAPAQAQIHVTPGGNSGSNGSTWGTATTLQHALDIATGSDEIWIAEGIYKPTGGTDRSASFTITGNQDGLKIYGGFEDGDAFADRNPAEHPVILSGDIDDNDAKTNGVTLNASDVNGANSHTVFFFDAGDGDIGADVGPNVTDATVLDGVTITGGSADGESAEAAIGGGLYCDGNGGGNECSPTLSNVIFTGNSAGVAGAMYNDGGEGGTSSPTITNAIFAYNSADVGGAIYNWGFFNGQSSPSITNATFVYNVSDSRGGAIINQGGGGASNPTITNVTFAHNSAAEGGAMANVGGDFSGGPSGQSTPTITNSILYGNDASDSGNEIFNLDANPSLSYSLVQGGVASIPGATDDGNNIDGDPLFVKPNAPAGLDGTFATGDDGMRLLSGSPALDAGDDSAISLTEDITGATRTQNGTVDMGAYEGAVSAPSQTIYVDASAGGAEDGTSWTDAYTRLHDALVAATGNSVVWIAEGVYTPTDDAGISDTNQDTSFTVTGPQDGLKIYGGFESGGNFGGRNPADHPVVLSGDIDDNDNTNANGVTETADDINGANSNYVFLFTAGLQSGSDGTPNITDATVLDGVTITGGGLYCDGSGTNNECSPTITNAIFAGNSASGNGGAMYNDGNGSGTSSPTITDVIFTGNEAGTNGGAIYNSGGSFTSGTSSPTITNVTFVNNSASDGGGAIYNSGSTSSPFDGGVSNPTITNASFINNSATNGGAVYNNGISGQSKPIVTNATFTGNTASGDGGAVVNNGEGGSTDGFILARIYNSILYGNSASDSGDEIYNNGGLTELRMGDDLIEGGLSGISENNGSTTTDQGDNFDGDPSFVNASDPDGSDNTFATGDDGLKLLTGSPALDVGANTATDLDRDVTGASRIQNGVIDLGAYEGAVSDPAVEIYVDTDAGGAEDGTSWTDAYTTLQDALDEATGNDRIFIAEGTYTPGPDAGDSYTVAGGQDGLKIYGGFENGDAFGDRSPSDHPVILDGNDTNNSVLFFNGKSGGTITNATVLEGVTVTGGAGNGGGLFCDGEGDGNACSPTLRTVIFAGNSTGGDGGALYLDGSDGGIASPVITNALFTENTAGSDGGAIASNGRNGGDASPALTNVTISGNEATNRGGALFNDDDGGTAGPVLTNALLWGNPTGSGGPIHNDEGSPSFSHSLVEGRSPGGTNLPGDADPQFVDPTDPDGEDDTLGTSDDGLRLFEGSPALDAGDDSAISLTEDVTGAPRTQSGTVDVGAYEGGMDAPLTLHVDAAAGSDANDGQSWGQAFATLTKALNAANSNDRIWIAEGTYRPTDSGDIPDGTRDTSFVVTGGQDGLEIYGGFENGDAFADRSAGDHPVVLSGDIGTADDASDNSYHVLEFDGTTGGTITGATLLQGVTVTGGNANGSSPDNRGGGLYCIGNGSGNECSPRVVHTAFVDNAAAAGGAIYNFGDGGTSTPTIVGSIFAGNTATIFGGAIVNNGNNGGTSSPAITNATLTGNSADDNGGAINNSAVGGGTSAPQITNTILWGNTAGASGNEVYNAESSSTISHSLVEGGVGSISGATDDGGNLSGDPLFADASDPNGADDQFGTEDDGLQVEEGSPVLDAGTPDTSGLGLPDTDLTGTARVVNNDPDATSGTIDLGAYEAPESVVLPVELASFRGTASGDAVTLTWQTASETGNAGFRVERTGERKNGGAGAWKEVGSVEGAGTTSEAQSYRFTDEEVPYAADSLTYRLKQVDTDGSVSFSNEITVGRRAVTQVELLGTFPNPARQQATVRFAIPEGKANETVRLRLYDVMGRRVQTVRSAAEAGRHALRLDVSGRASGVYFLRLTVGGTMKTQKLTVVQ